MPTHWESSERPLFVKTVVVNGSRHAILSHVDPLCQARKADGPGTTCQGCSTATAANCLNINRDDAHTRRARSCYPAKRDISSDLQNCLVKLRVVLSSHENKKTIRKDLLYLKDDEPGGKAQYDNWKNVKSLEKMQRGDNYDFSNVKPLKPEEIPGYRRGNSYCGMMRKKDYDDYFYSEDTDSYLTFKPAKPEIEYPVKDSAKVTDRSNFVQNIIPLSESTEEILKNYSSYFFPMVYIKANTVTWKSVEAEGYVASNYNNPLSERVLQWLELARKRKENLEKEKLESDPKYESPSTRNSEMIIGKFQRRKNKTLRTESATNKNTTEKGNPANLKKSNINEDVEEEVKKESDIETALSSAVKPHEYPKYTRELNKLHIMKAMQDSDTYEQFADEEQQPLCDNYWENAVFSIPEKALSDFSITEQLKQSILESFEAIVNLEQKVPISDSDSTYLPRRSFRETTNSEARTGRKNTFLMKQTNIRISSDEEENELPLRSGKFFGRTKRCGRFRREKAWRYQRRRTSLQENQVVSDDSCGDTNMTRSQKLLNTTDKDHGGRRMWATEKGANKPHLHIFMPEIDPKLLEAQEESASDTESFPK